MRNTFHSVRYVLDVLAALYGICFVQPAMAQPAARFDVVEATAYDIHAAMRAGS